VLNIIELGSGYSTFLLSLSGFKVTSYEENRLYKNYIESYLWSKSKSKIILSETNDTTYTLLDLNQEFDLIFVDGPFNKDRYFPIKSSQKSFYLAVDDIDRVDIQKTVSKWESEGAKIISQKENLCFLKYNA
jgi:16S rRNA G966 N2-methylase RsmD